MKVSNENGSELAANALDRKVSLTGYTNVVLDNSKSDEMDEDRHKLGYDGAINVPEKRKYSGALQVIKDGKLPINKVGIFSYVFPTWFSPLIWRMHRNRHEPVAEKDIWQCASADGIMRNAERMDFLWTEEVERNGGKEASFYRVWVEFILTRTMANLLLLAINALFTFLSLTVALFWCEIIRALSYPNVFVFGALTGARFRSGYMGIMYKKLLKLRTVKGKTSSEIINVFSVDSYRVNIATSVCVFLLSVPIYALIGTVRQMAEIINSIKFIKMYAWEKPFNDAIQVVRLYEQTYVLYSALVSAITLAIIPVTPTIASVVTITVYTAAGNDLTASTAFAVIGTMNFLRGIVAVLPLSLRAYAEAKVSFNRLEKLLLMDEYIPLSSITYDKTNALEMKAASFMLQTKGHLAVDVNVAYVAQQAWIFNASLRENILFGSEFEEQKYRKAIECCERGANLSGGQKQRVNLARAVYSDSDIYLLDDPLSALDVRVGRLIFNECIKSQLARKTVILVTHQLQFLKECDEVVVMDGGEIAEKDRHIDLINNGDGLGVGEPAPSLKETSQGSSVKTANGMVASSDSKPNGILKKKNGKGKLVSAEEAAIGEGNSSTSDNGSFLNASYGAPSDASTNAVNRLHSLCLDRVMKAPMSFFDSNPTGRILNRFSKDLDEGDVFLPQVTNSLLRIHNLTLVSIALSAYITPWILIEVVPVVIVFYIMKQISTVAITKLKRLENISRSPLISHRSFGHKQQERFYDRCSKFGDVASLTVFLFDVSIRWIGMRLHLAAGIFTVACSLIFVITKGLVPPAAAGLVLGLCGSNLISEPQDAKKVVSPTWPENGGLSFQGVVMRYRPEMDPVLRKVSFNIYPREKIGIVIGTGAGKSSLAACLFRLVEISEGAITIDGEDISLLSLKTLCSKISKSLHLILISNRCYCSQFPIKLHAALIEQFEDSLEVVVDENGENFSVGERQLLCLARAIIRKSKILLLDEATANIDTSTDAMIQQTIRNCFAECTVITIAHRLNTVLHSDRIIVLDAEQVMEIGTPQDLLSNPHSFFNGMIAAQTVKTPSP
ncbi:MRP1-like protein [Mya arenaria]|uniref:MRP1-like protein n=1 Tax=Mya arenaria TaxID=6604 RepID=A0ABY7DYK9_MYAAR|nr:MRP1-like protein [Mya arenaria]